MSDPEHRRDEEAPSRSGAWTATSGTPVAVDVTRERQARTVVAGFLAGPVLWSVHFMVVYLVAEAGCTGDGPGLVHFDPPVPLIVTLVATALAAVAGLLAAGSLYRQWRLRRGASASQPCGENPGLPTHDPGGTLAFGGMLLALLSVVTILFVGLPALVLPAC